MDYAYKITTNGRAAMAAYMALGDKPFHLTRVAFGSGRVEEGANLADVHELLEYVSEGAISERSHQDDRLRLTIQYANSAHKDVPTFLLSEFAVYVEDPETGAETDLLYGTLGDYRQPVPAYHLEYPGSVFNFPLEIILSDELQVSVSAPAGLVTWDDLAQTIRTIAVSRRSLTIPAEGWEKAGEGTYPCRLELAAEGVTTKQIPTLTVLEAGEDAASACGLAPWVETLDGAIRLAAVSVPAEPIPASLTLQGDAAGIVVGPDGVVDRFALGAGLRYDQDGGLALDAAKPADVAALFHGSEAE